MLWTLQNKVLEDINQTNTLMTASWHVVAQLLVECLKWTITIKWTLFLFVLWEELRLESEWNTVAWRFGLPRTVRWRLAHSPVLTDTHRSRCFFRGSSVYSTGNDPNPTDAGPSGGEVLTHFCHFISSVKCIRSDACSVFGAGFERWYFPPVTKGNVDTWRFACLL